MREDKHKSKSMPLGLWIWGLRSTFSAAPSMFTQRSELSYLGQVTRRRTRMPVAQTRQGYQNHMTLSHLPLSTSSSGHPTTQQR